MLRLGATGGTELTVSADGPDAAEALAAIALAFAHGLGEGKAEPAAPAQAPVPSRPVVAYGGRVVAGVSASPGIATGPVWHFKRERLVVNQHAPDPGLQRERLSQALAGATAELNNLYQEFWKKAGTAKADIFKAHLELLDDPRWSPRPSDASAPARAPAGRGGRRSRREAESLAKLDDPLLAGRATDLRDVGTRVLRRLAGVIEERAVACLSRAR